MNFLNANGFQNRVPKDNFNQISLEGIKSLLKVYPAAAACENQTTEVLQIIASSNEESMKYLNLIYSPIIYINNMIYKGDFYNEQHLYQTICFSYQDFPPICNKLKSLQTSKIIKEHSVKNFFLKLSFFFASLTILAIFSLYFFIKKKQQADLKQDLQKKIDQALSEYYNTANQTYYRNK